jgi:hypothetical protein
MTPPDSSSPDAPLDSLALCEAVLRKDETALAVLLDSGDNRRQAAMLAEICAQVLAARYPGPLALLARMRPVLMAADGGG